MSIARWRAILAEGVRANPVAPPRDPAILARLADPEGDVAFEEFDFDSLARLELCIWLELEAGIIVTEDEMAAHGGLRSLAAHLAARTA